MNAIRHIVVAALLAVWSFPAMALAKNEPASPPPLPALVTSTAAPGAAEQRAAEKDAAARYAARDQQAQQQNLQDWKGGEGVSIYVGSGVLLVLVVVLLILLI